ncbi:MAG: YdiY family protein [Limisphaerales bacterium]
MNPSAEGIPRFDAIAPTPAARDRKPHGPPEPAAVRRFRRSIVPWFALVLLAAPSRGDVLTGTRGERLIGRVIQELPDSVVFESELAGVLTIPKSRIQAIEKTPDPVPPPPVTPPVSLSPSTAPAELVKPPPPLSLSPSPPPESSSPPTPPQVQPAWFTMPSSGKGSDWIQLNSGEWLRGQLRSMQKRRLEFDSEKLDDRSFDWDDVTQVWAPGANDVLFEDRITASGALRITPETVTVSGLETNTFPRADLVTIAPGGKSELDHWTARISAGLSLRTGNTRQVDYNAHVQLGRYSPSTRLTLEYLGNVGRVDDTDTINNHRATAQFDYFLSGRFFVRVPSVEYYRDVLQNLKHRITAGAGAGYDIVSNDRTLWSLWSGPAYQRNEFDSVESGDDQTTEALALVIGSRFEYELNRRIDLSLEYRGQITRREVGETTHHGVAVFEIELTRRLDLDVSLVWDRISSPQSQSDGSTPLRDDFRLTLGLAVDL